MGRGMISAAQPEAAEAGALVLKRGGNAVDAAVACALVQTVVDPQMCGIAGFGTMQIYFPGRDYHGCIDFHTRAPAAVREDMWAGLIEGEARDGFGFFLKGRVNEVGYQSIMTPGSLMAFHEAVRDFGTMEWRDVVDFAVAEARRGFVVRPHVHAYWTVPNDFGRLSTADKLGFTASGRRIYFNGDGSLKRLGQRVENADMVRTLERIRDMGAADFYTGEIAQEIAADMAANGGLLSQQDLARYRTRRTEPLWTEYRGYRVAANPPPGGGVMVLQMLNILENFDLSHLGHNTPDYIAVVAEAMKYATIDKDTRIGDPEFVAVPVAELLDKGCSGDLARRIRAGEKAHVERLQGAPVARDTTHVCAVDGEGNCVSMTHSLGPPSGVITEGLGFMYNGCMTVFDPRPGRAGSLAPGKGRFTAMSPAIVFKGDMPHIVIGAPGGTFITMGVLQGILNQLDFGMTPLEAVSAPRFTCNSDTIDVSNRIPRFVTDELEARGYPVARSYLSYAFAGVHTIRIDGDRLSGAADPGRDGMALAV